ncbi:MAG: hypothetical protein QOE22_550 [Candidatus Parcubacteria bacterium]|jgi:hypothetical protein|nr:hypothetical protein [Candidatus Parcubacteria bacterium]
MKIVLATPLYPPDIAEPAPYAKELATRLAKTDEVIIVTYGHIPEDVDGVRMRAVSKQRPLPFRLIAYTFALLRTARDADILYMQNGPSVELPVAIASFFRRTPIVMRIGDEAAHTYARTRPQLQAIERFALRRAKEVVTDSPDPRPEILPFRDHPVAELDAFERSWETHIAGLRETFRALCHV